MDQTRNAPRDLYDLWALAQAGWINADAAHLYKKLGPIGSYPTEAALPKRPPTQKDWEAALSHQCRIQVDADVAFSSEIQAWTAAVREADR